MRVIRWPDLPAAGFRERPSALTIGVFDGVHIGHRAILDRLVRPESGRLPVVVTFSRHPQSVLSPHVPRKDLITAVRKLATLEALGVGAAVMIDFSREFSKMTAESFFQTLAGAFRIAAVVEGENFHFGKDREAGRQALAGFCASIGATLETAPLVIHQGLPVSSTRIRRAVQAGALADARAMLGGAYAVDLPEHETASGGNGTAVIDRDRIALVLPEKGVFRCRAEAVDGNGEAELTIEKEKIFIRSQLSSIKTLYFE